VGMGTMFTATGGDAVHFLSLYRPLVHTVALIHQEL